MLIVMDQDDNMIAKELHVFPYKVWFYETNISELIQNYQMQYCLMLENLFQGKGDNSKNKVDD